MIKNLFLTKLCNSQWLKECNGCQSTVADRVECFHSTVWWLTYCNGWKLTVADRVQWLPIHIYWNNAMVTNPNWLTDDNGFQSNGRYSMVAERLQWLIIHSCSKGAMVTNPHITMANPHCQTECNSCQSTQSDYFRFSSLGWQCLSSTSSWTIRP